MILSEQPRALDLADLREHLLAHLIEHLPTGPHAQGTDTLPVRDAAPFDFGQDAQGEIIRHLAIGCVMPSTRLVRGRARDSTSAIAQTITLIRVAYRIRPHQQDEDYAAALRLLSVFGRSVSHAVHACPFDAEIVDTPELALTPALSGEPYLYLTATLTLAHPLEV